MGYYRGDGNNYYRGDYYRGDPFLGALGAAAGRLAGRVLPKVAQVAGRALGLVSPSRRGTAQRIQQISRDVLVGTAGYQMGRSTGAGSAGIPQISGPSHDATIDTLQDTVIDLSMKKPYRRMNPLNPRALRRALRRARGFEKFAKKTVNAMYKVVDGRRVSTFKKKSR